MSGNMNNDACWIAVQRAVNQLQLAASSAVQRGEKRDFQGVEQALDEVNRCVTKARVPLRQVER